MATQYAVQYEAFAWSLTKEAIGQALRERYAVPTELPPRLLALVKKLSTIEGKPRLRTLISRLDAIEGSYLLRHAPPAEPRRVGPSNRDWPVCT
jgi:hypothetical protein